MASPAPDASPLPAGAVFLSYAHEDAAAAQRIVAALHEACIEVWFDQSELRGGDTWDQKIKKQIRECALFLPVISANTDARAEGYFRLEWRLADQRTHLMGRSKPFLVPVCIDNTSDANADVPDSFLTVQWTRLAGGDSPPAFATRIRDLLAPTASSAPASPSFSRTRSSSPSQSREKSVAVMAFANLSHDAENEYFSDGISEELLNVLAKIPSLHVTARSSSFFFKGKNVPVPEIAQRLGVAYVLEGSVRRAGSRVRITAQLIDAAEDCHVWSEAYDRELSDIFALQDEVASDIARNFQLKIAAATARGAVNPEVHRLVLHGRHFWNQYTPEALANAEAMFTKAIELDPGYAPASTGLGNVWCRRAIIAFAASRHIAPQLAAAERHANRALQIDAGSAEPFAVLGTVAFIRGQLREAERAFQQALLVNPNSDLALVYHARLLQRVGRPDLAIPEMEMAQLLNPLSAVFGSHHGMALMACRRHADAVPMLESAETLVGAPPWTWAMGAIALAKLGRRDEAVRKAHSALDLVAKKKWSRSFTAFSDGLAAWALAEGGAHAEAEAVVQQLRLEPEASRYSAGFALATLGQREEAFALLAEISQWVVDYLLLLGDQNKAVRSDAQFGELLCKLDALDAFETLRRTLGELEPKR